MLQAQLKLNAQTNELNNVTNEKISSPKSSNTNSHSTDITSISSRPVLMCSISLSRLSRIPPLPSSSRQATLTVFSNANVKSSPNLKSLYDNNGCNNNDEEKWCRNGRYEESSTIENGRMNNFNSRDYYSPKHTEDSKSSLKMEKVSKREFKNEFNNNSSDYNNYLTSPNKDEKLFKNSYKKDLGIDVTTTSSSMSAINTSTNLVGKPRKRTSSSSSSSYKEKKRKKGSMNSQTDVIDNSIMQPTNHDRLNDPNKSSHQPQSLQSQQELPIKKIYVSYFERTNDDMDSAETRLVS